LYVWHAVDGEARSLDILVQPRRAVIRTATLAHAQSPA
jgi:hypothetical protein